ncbi:hypothetical protein AgCh_035748 [Apium graveolens]
MDTRSMALEVQEELPLAEAEGEFPGVEVDPEIEVVVVVEVEQAPPAFVGVGYFSGLMGRGILTARLAEGESGRMDGIPGLGEAAEPGRLMVTSLYSK